MVAGMRCGHCGHDTDPEDVLRALQLMITVPILRQLARIERLIRTGDQAEMTALEDLQAADATLASNVQDLVTGVQDIVAGVDKLDADYDRLVDAVNNSGANDAALQSVVDSLGQSVQQIKDAKDSLATSKAKIDEDFPAPTTPGTGDADGTPDGGAAPGTVGA
jgi:small-conductance mechanosensitive channel